MTPPPKVEESAEDAAMARKLRATGRACRLAEFMCADVEDGGLGLWKEKGHATLFLAAFAVLAKMQPIKPGKGKDSKLEDVVNYYSTQKSIQDIGELAALHLAAGNSESVDETLVTLMPGYVEAGLEALEPILRGPDPLPRLVEKLEALGPGKKRR
ncbi:MAG: hypothetical protein AABX89_03880 [Candidatus Thermoplasmatota archaeon]